MSTLIKPISSENQGKRGWKVELNGQEVPEVTSLRLKSRFGELNYGMTPPGYDGWSFREEGGGGSVLVPFCYVGDELHIGLVSQTRHNQGGEVPNLPRGFLEPGESHFRAATRELTEETDVPSTEPAITALPGAPTNPNSAFFETPEKNEGVKFFAAEFREDQLELDSGVYQFKKDILEADPDGPAAKLAEQILGVLFLPWHKAAQVGDMFTVAGVGRLQAYLHTRK